MWPAEWFLKDKMAAYMEKCTHPAIFNGGILWDLMALKWKRIEEIESGVKKKKKKKSCEKHCNGSGIEVRWKKYKEDSSGREVLLIWKGEKSWKDYQGCYEGKATVCHVP